MHDEDGLEQHTLRSVGIDIGSATSHFTVSRLVVRRRGSALSAEFVVSERETAFRSPVWLTPYRGGDEIDTDRLRALFESGYRAAGIAPTHLEVGGVVITGEALNKRNAEPIARMVAWIVLVLALVLGCIEAMDKPTRHTFVVEMVGRDHLTNARQPNSAPLRIAMPASRVARRARAGLYEGLTNRSMSTVVPDHRPDAPKWSGRVSDGTRR